MIIWTDKAGNKLTPKEFLKRWKTGMQGVTPLQQTQVQVRSTWIMVVGILAGIGISLYGFKNLWWLLIILVGALFNTLVQLLGLWQKANLFKQLEESIQLQGGLK